MFSKRLLTTFLAFLVVIGVGSVSFAAYFSQDPVISEEYGNMAVTLLNGGYSADYADGMVLFSNPDDDGNLWLRNTASGSARKITDEKASFINVVGRNIYYISSDSESYFIVKTNLNSGREVVAESETELSNLFVSSESIYYLRGNSVVHYNISDGTQTVIFTDPEIEAFVPNEDGVYWLNDKPVFTQSLESCHAENYEGTEEENINFSCYSYSSVNGTSIPANYAEVVSVKSTNSSNINSLALSAEIGGVKIPTDEYPVGSYFTDNGSRCTNHGTGSCGWESEAACNCKAYYNGVSLKAIQCYGYARYIYYKCFGELGFSDSASSTNLGTLEKGTVTPEGFKALIEKAEPGAHLRVQYIKSNGYSVSTHSMIILDSNESGFSVCEANADNKCGVSVRRIAYADFIPTVVSVNFLMMPDDYPGFTESTTQPVATPGDATSQTTPGIVPTTSVEESVETTSSGVTADSDVVEIILDIMSFLMQLFVDCINVIIRIFASII